MNEVWKPIPGFEKYYEASNLGRIRSLDREQTRPGPYGGTVTWKWQGRILRVINTAGKSCPHVHLNLQGEVYSYRISVLVIAAFQEIPLDKLYRATIDHIDGDKYNNYIDNLKLVRLRGIDNG